MLSTNFPKWCILRLMEVTSTDLCDDMLRFLRYFKAAMLALAEEQGLTPVQQAAIITIDRQGELPMGKVADALHCDASNVTGIVDRLVSQGIVERKECPSDRRAKTLQLTAKGKEAASTLNQRMPEVLGCHALSDAEREQLRHMLQKICASSDV